LFSGIPQEDSRLSIDDNDEVDRIAIAVREYLEAHPHAADTLEGVVKWWLVRQRYDQAEERVRKALALLTQEGYVLTAKTADGRDIFSSAGPDQKNSKGN
jgi:hypothetical protein